MIVIFTEVVGTSMVEANSTIYQISIGKMPIPTRFRFNISFRCHAPHQGRVNMKKSLNGVGAWCAEDQDQSQYLQVDLGRLTTIKAIAIQGESNLNFIDYYQYNVIH